MGKTGSWRNWICCGGNCYNLNSFGNFLMFDFVDRNSVDCRKKNPKILSLSVNKVYVYKFKWFWLFFIEQIPWSYTPKIHIFLSLGHIFLLYYWKRIFIQFISIVRALWMSKMNSENTTNIFYPYVRLTLKKYWVVQCT